MQSNSTHNAVSPSGESTSVKKEVGSLASLDISSVTRGIVQGDAMAFTSFYQAVFTQLYRYLLVCSRGREDLVQEAIQETMLRVMRTMKPFEQAGDLWAWVCCVARSALIDQVRKEQRHNPNRHQSGIGKCIQATFQQDTNRELEEHLRHCLNELDPKDRALVEGKYYKRQTYRTLAQTWRLTPKAVESRLARIRKKLKILLLKRLNHEPLFE